MCDFPSEVLHNILVQLPPRDLVNVQVVCSSWKHAALPARRQAFLARWGLLDVVNLPRHTSLYETADLSIIVHSHSLLPGDTLPALALRFQQPLSTVKRINNLLSDASVHHRHCLYIPVSGLQAVAGCTAHFEYSPVLCRDLVVILQDPVVGEGCVADEGSGGEAPLSRAPDLFNRMLLREFRAKVRQQMNGSTAPTDIEAAKFYLHESRGDCAAAARMFVADLGWEGSEGAVAAAAATAAHPTAGLLAMGVPCSCSCKRGSSSPGLHPQQKPVAKWIAKVFTGILGCGLCRKGKGRNKIQGSGGLNRHHSRSTDGGRSRDSDQQGQHAGTKDSSGSSSSNGFGAKVLRAVNGGHRGGDVEEEEGMLQGERFEKAGGSGEGSCACCRAAASRFASAAAVTVMFEDMSLRT